MAACRRVGSRRPAYVGPMKHTDVIVAGGGIAGLTAACALASQGHAVILLDPRPEDAPPDLRTTAFLQPARDLLDEAGVWDGLGDHPTPLAEMRVVDLGARRPVRADFRASEVSDRPFGWNVVNARVRGALVARADGLGVERRRAAVQQVLARTAGVRVVASDEATLAARLLVGADGRDSIVRAALGIGVRTLRTGQKALSFAVEHDAPHGAISTELYRDGGPFVLVPLPDEDGRHRSSVVWMERGPEARRLHALPDDAFAAAVTERSGGVMGPLRPFGPRALFPLVTCVADRFCGPRTALMAEAAHAVPPVGAQGLNMSLADVALLAEVSRHGLGEAEGLERYARERRRDVLARVAAITALNAASMGSAPPLRAARAFGIRALGALAPVRRELMRRGMGT